MPKPPSLWVLDAPPASRHHLLYVHLCCMKYLLDAISPGHQFGGRLKTLLYSYRTVDQKALGFPVHWQDEPFWQ